MDNKRNSIIFDPVKYDEGRAPRTILPRVLRLPLDFPGCFRWLWLCPDSDIILLYRNDDFYSTEGIIDNVAGSFADYEIIISIEVMYAFEA